MKNKRGGITTALLDFWSYIMFVLIILAFYGLFTMTVKDAKESRITEASYNEKSGTTLLNYLRTPIYVPEAGGKIIIADLVAYSYENDKENFLAVKSKEVLNPILGDKWAIDLCTDDCWWHDSKGTRSDAAYFPTGFVLGEECIPLPTKKGPVKICMRLLK